MANKTKNAVLTEKTFLDFIRGQELVVTTTAEEPGKVVMVIRGPFKGAFFTDQEIADLKNKGNTDLTEPIKLNG